MNIINNVRVLAIGLLLAAAVVSQSASSQQKPTLKQLEQQARERLEADRRRRQELETEALEHQRREVAAASAAAAAAAEAERQRLLDDAVKDKAREERTPVVNGDSLLCPSGGYRRKAARLVDTYSTRVPQDGGLRGSFGGTFYKDGPPFGWVFLPEYWTKPPVKAFVFRNTDATRRVESPQSLLFYPALADPVLYAEETELKTLAEMASESFLLLGRNSGEFRERFSLIGKSGDVHELNVSMEQITLTTNGKIYDAWFRENDGDQAGLNRPLYLCIDGILQERILIDLFRTTVDKFGARKKISWYSVLIVTDIPFT